MSLAPPDDDGAGGGDATLFGGASLLAVLSFPRPPLVFASILSTRLLPSSLGLLAAVLDLV